MGGVAVLGLLALAAWIYTRRQKKTQGVMPQSGPQSPQPVIGQYYPPKEANYQSVPQMDPRELAAYPARTNPQQQITGGGWYELPATSEGR